MTSLTSRLAHLVGRRRPTAPTPEVTIEEKASAAGPLIALQSLSAPVWTPRDYAALAREGFMQNAIVYRCVRMIAEAAATVPLLLYDGDIEIEQHPLLDLIARPNPVQSGTDLLESWFGYLLVSGNGYLEGVSLNGAVRELYALRPDRMKVVPGPDGWPSAYEYTVGGSSVRYGQDAGAGIRPILHQTLFHPLSDHYGMSPIEAAATAIDIHNAASAWNKALLDNSARPSGALVYAAREGRMTPEQFGRLKSELEESFEGARNAGRPMLLEGGLDWKSMSLSPKDMDFLEAKHASAREIALSIGVPPMLLGIPGDNTFSNYQEANRVFWRQTVLPLVKRTAQGLSSWLAAPLQFKPDHDAIDALTGDRDALWTRLQATTFLTDDEKRAAVGYGPKGTAVHPLSPLAGRGQRHSAAVPRVRSGREHELPVGSIKLFDPNQPRVPTGSGRESGRWTSPEASVGGQPAAVDPVNVDYSPDQSGWHDYTAGPNIVCSSDLQCTSEEMADYLSRYSVPGRDPDKPVANGEMHIVIDPRTDILAGWVRTYVSDDGLTIANVTSWAHILYDGMIIRTMTQGADGSWSVTTRGIGNNVIPGMNWMNEWQGPQIFNFVDQSLRGSVELHHGIRKKAATAQASDMGSRGSLRGFHGFHVDGVVGGT